jgi:hypothetical protein
MRKLLLLLLLAGCDSDASTSAIVTIPIDTVTVIQVDSVGVNSIDTIFVTDTIIVHDSTFVVDTIITQSKYDSLVFPLAGYIGDATMETLDLGTFHLQMRAQVWVLIELSANSQKDEAWGIEVSPQGISETYKIPRYLDCPLVPDYPWLGEGWVFVGFVESGTFSLEARHASLYNCYSPVDSFKTANSVHFEKIKFLFHVTAS